MVCLNLWLYLFVWFCNKKKSAFTLADNHNALTVISIWIPVFFVSALLLFFYFLSPFLRLSAASNFLINESFHPSWGWNCLSWGSWSLVWSSTNTNVIFASSFKLRFIYWTCMCFTHLYRLSVDSFLGQELVWEGYVMIDQPVILSIICFVIINIVYLLIVLSFSTC
jgi:hypothetical protein